MRIETDKIYCGDSLQVLQTLPDNCLDCCVTSPPYYGLRDYGTDGQIGREAVSYTHLDVYKRQVLTDPKGTVLIECGKLLQRAGYRIKVLNLSLIHI